ncbi:MAG: phosphatidate cytidylyltransferase [Microbacterium gubbeenense]|uniref:phosphatidate cytidylyltransferase n=2 Tax=Microbacterium gubbeenense TaxID=159896 RepID=UPI00146DE19E|nr:phosphatidate cytidylyltransferase [Microbacterium gubbeenense]
MTGAGDDDPQRETPAEDPSRPEAGSASLQARLTTARDDFENRVDRAREQIDATNARIMKRTGRDLFAAIGVGVIAGAAVIGSLLFLKWVFAILALAIAGLGVFEITRALQARGRRIDLVPQLVAVVIIISAAFWFHSAVHWTALFLALAFIVVWRVVAQMSGSDGRVYASIFTDIIVGCFISIYVPFLASSALVLLRHEGGEWWILAFLLVVVAADTGAYATGLAFGRHKMAPRISPGKTWEGFAGGAVVSLIAGALAGEFMLGIPWWAGAIFAAPLVLSAMMGDLGESMIKRDLGIKDMSSWLPGHGGVLDRLDSILPSAVVALAMFQLLAPLGAS